jgi:predicted Zn finger-like uncharacterized protein
MIIACPACDTRYAVPETAIGAEGRTVRCAKCKHSWFQEPIVRATPAAPPPIVEPASSKPAPPASEPAGAPPPIVQDDQPVAAPSIPDPTAGPSQPADAVAEPSISHWRTEDASAAAPPISPDSPAIPDEAAATALRALRRGRSQAAGAVATASGSDEDQIAPPVYDDTEPAEEEEYSQFGYNAPFSKRRNTAKMWSIAAAIFAALAIGTAAAVNYYGVPDWLPFERPTFGMAKPGLELDFPPEQNRAETLESGETIFRVRGTINNAARETIAVPNLLVVFRDERERPVANWVVTPAKRELAPGERLNVTEAIADIPAAAEYAEIGWAPR